MEGHDLPMYTEAEAVDYAEGCAQRWCAAVALGRPLSREEWKTIQPPSLWDVPSGLWSVVHAVWKTQTGLTVNDAMRQWFDWFSRWFERPKTWLEILEAELRAYDDVLAEFTEAELRGDTEHSSDAPV